MREEIYQLWSLSIPELRILLQAAGISGIYGISLPKELSDKELAQAVYRMSRRGILRMGKKGFILEDLWQGMLEYMRTPEQIYFFESGKVSEFCFQKQKNLYLGVDGKKHVNIGFLETEIMVDMILEHTGMDSEPDMEKGNSSGDRIKEYEKRWVETERNKIFDELVKQDQGFFCENKRIFLAGKSRAAGQETQPCVSLGYHPFFYYLLYRRRDQSLGGEEYSRTRLRELLFEMLEGGFQ